jgi:uncharacterized protein
MRVGLRWNSLSFVDQHAFIAHMRSICCVGLLVTVGCARGRNAAPEGRSAVTTSAPIAVEQPTSERCGSADATDNPTSCIGTGPFELKINAKNVFGGTLQACPSKFATGFERTGFCNTGGEDVGVHVVCAAVTDAFLQFSKNQGNDLISPRGTFPGLSKGDAWCLCASRWKQALEAGVAPPVFLNATDAKALDFVTMKDLQIHQLP